MAKIRITRTWPDDDYISILVVADSGYPQELHEAERVALNAFAEASRVVAGQPVDEAQA